MSLLSYAILEVSTLVLFGLTVWHAWRRGRGPLLELIMASSYGILLEWGDILIFRTYHYSPLFWLAVGPVPITIGLCWGMLIYGAMAYSDQLGVPRWAAPWADAFWAILLDLAFDAVAIRLQLWTWTVPMDAGYFGVPADNFWAWIWVALSFSAYVRWVRARRTTTLRTVLLFLSPVAAFAGLLFGIGVFNVLVDMFYGARFVPGDGLLLFAGLLLGCGTITATTVWRRRDQIRHGIDLIPTAVRWAMHGYFLLWAVFLFVRPDQRLPGMDMPRFLVVVALVLAAGEIVLVSLVARRKHPLRKQIVIAPSPQAVDAVRR